MASSTSCHPTSNAVPPLPPLPAHPSDREPALDPPPPPSRRTNCPLPPTRTNPSPPTRPFPPPPQRLPRVLPLAQRPINPALSTRPTASPHHPGLAPFQLPPSSLSSLRPCTSTSTPSHRCMDPCPHLRPPPSPPGCSLLPAAAAAAASPAPTSLCQPCWPISTWRPPSPSSHHWPPAL